MKKLFFIILFFVSFNTTYAKNFFKNKTCLEKFEITRGNNILKDLQKNNENIFLEATLNFKSFSPIEDFKLNNDYLLWKKQKGIKIVINGKYFTNLKQVDATTINKGENKLLGKLLNQKVSYLQLIDFLLKTNLIISYWHLESNICLEKVKNNKKEYIAYFIGIHKYCTNKCQNGSLKFAIKFNKKNGKIILLGY